MGVRVLLVTVGVISVLASAGTNSPNDPARAFLISSLNVTSSDMHRIDSGQVFSRTLDVSDRREVATLGVVRIKMTPAFYVERLADIAHFKRDEAVLQIGTFGNPPDVGDVADLTLDDSDVRSLRGCRVGDCGIQLSAEAIERFRHDVDWERADAPRQANVLMREILVDYVAKYRKAGTRASMQYADRAEPLNLAREFVSLAASDLGAWQRFPALRRHLLAYPADGVSGAIDVFYWSKERVGRRGVVSITHLAIARTASESGAEYAIASKHLYGTHYYDASLGLTILVRDSSTSSPATYLAYVNRSRVDVFDGIFGGIARRIVTTRARSTVSDQLARMQQSLEQQFALSHAH
jgi:hypothetical protein